MKVFLIAARGKQKGTLVPIHIDLFLLGSDKVCQLRCSTHGVGPQHCAIVTRQRKVFVRDMDSGFPTLINGREVSPGSEVPLHVGDRLALGPLEFVVQFNEKALSQRDLEEWALSCLDVSAERERSTTEDDGRRTTDKYTNAAQAAASILDQMQVKRGVVRGRLRVGVDDGLTTIRFNDVYLVEESEVALVKRELFEQIDQPDMRVLIDLKNVRRMSSTAVEMIADVYKRLASKGGRMAICRIRKELSGILHTLHLSDQVRVFHDKRTAVAANW